MAKVAKSTPLVYKTILASTSQKLVESHSRRLKAVIDAKKEIDLKVFGHIVYLCSLIASADIIFNQRHFLFQYCISICQTLYARTYVLIRAYFGCENGIDYRENHCIIREIEVYSI